jgi:Protein of unknown function (DUF1552)
MFITRKTLSRRTVLRGVGTAVALPFLDAMSPAMAAPSPAPMRFGFLYHANGVIQKQWIPTTTGRGFALPPILEPLANVKDSISVISGLAHLQADTFGDGTGDHPRASAAWLTGVHAYDRTRPDVQVRLATTADQLIARQAGRDTRLPSLEMSVDYPTQGACDTGDCFYVNTISWRNETTPNPTEMHPRVVFERLFGDGGSAQARRVRMQQTGSILDSVMGEVGRLSNSLGPGDRSKLTEYLDSVRELETRSKSPETQPTNEVDLIERPTEIPDTFDAYTKLMFDLQLLAFQTDTTRVFSMIMARELSSRTFAFIGVPDQHHAVSHHRNDPELIAKKAKIDAHLTSLYAYFLEKMAATQDGDGSLLDHSLLLYGGGMGDGNLHRHFDLPTLLAGKLGGRIQSGFHQAYPQNTPMCNLLLTVMDKAGVAIDKFGDGTGRLQPDPLTL